MTVTIPKSEARPRFILVIGVLLGMAMGVAAGTNTLVVQGQLAFQNGDFNQAAAVWQQAMESFRSQGNINSEVETSISLASAYQSIGQQQRAVQILKDAFAHAEISGNKSLVTLAQSKLGAALVMTRDEEQAAVMLNDALDAARAGKNWNLE